LTGSACGGLSRREAGDGPHDQEEDTMETPITSEQLRMLVSLHTQRSLPLPSAETLAAMSKWEASELISRLRSGAAPIENLADLEADVMARVAERVAKEQQAAPARGRPRTSR
jgi:cell division septum initiation protein DivIVA